MRARKFIGRFGTRHENSPNVSAGRALVAMIAPMAVAAVSQILMGFADVAIVGHIPGLPLAAVGVGAALYALVSQIVTASGVGYQILASRTLGAGDSNRVTELLTAASIISLSVAALGACSMSLLGQHLANALLDDPAIETAAAEWLDARAPGLLFYAAAVLLRMTLDADRQPKWGMLTALSQNVLNAIVTGALVYGWLDVPKLGIAGSALGSSIADLYALIVMLLIHKRVRILQLCVRPVRTRVVDIWRIGAPEMVNAALDYSGTLAFVAVIGLLGDVAVSSGQVVLTVLLIVFTFAMVVGVAVQILAARAWGAGDVAAGIVRVRAAVRGGAPVFLCLGALLAIFARDVASLVAGAESTVEGALPPLRLIGLCMPLMLLTAIYTGALRADRRTATVMRVNVACVWLVELPVALLGSQWAGWGLTGAFLGFGAYFTVRAGVTWSLVRKRFAPQVNIGLASVEQVERSRKASKLTGG